MFGISWSEFFVILLVGVLVIPARHWPDVARFVARVIKFVRGIAWKISDATENIKQQIDIEKPIDEILNTTTNDLLDEFSSVVKIKNQPKKKTRKKAAK